MQLIYSTNIPAPYTVDFLNELSNYCDLTVLFERESASDRDSSWDNMTKCSFDYHFCKGIDIGTENRFSLMQTVFFLNVYFLNKSVGFLIGNATSFTGILSIFFLKLFHIPYWIIGDGAFPSPRKNIKLLVKRYIYKSAEGVFSTGVMHDNYYIQAGVDVRRIYRLNFTSIRENQIRDIPVDDATRKQLRRENNIEGRFVILYVGQMIHRKGVDLLIEAVSSLDDVELYCVGGIYESIHDYPSNIHFIAFKSQQELKAYYDCADVFVLPTREDIWGLVVNEALSRGLPVITTNRCNAGVELIRNGKNGYVVSAGNVSNLHQAICSIKDCGNMEEMRINAISSIKDYTIERMAEQVINTVGVKK